MIITLGGQVVTLGGLIVQLGSFESDGPYVSHAISAQGVAILIESSVTPGLYNPIPEIKDFNGPGGSAAVIDVTDIASTGKEKRMGLHDEGQLSFTGFFVPGDAQHVQLRTDRSNRTKRNFKMIFTDDPATEWSFSAYVTQFQISGGVDQVIEMSVALEITGSIVES
jgi:predicted secreted protein